MRGAGVGVNWRSPTPIKVTSPSASASAQPVSSATFTTKVGGTQLPHGTAAFSSPPMPCTAKTGSASTRCLYCR